MTDDDLLEQITRVRARNNVNWIDLLRIALRADPKSTKEVLSKILVMDLEISRLMRAMGASDWSPRDLAKKRDEDEDRRS
jgi:hypothetical protein